jgi:hypothetical protein
MGVLVAISESLAMCDCRVKYEGLEASCLALLRVRPWEYDKIIAAYTLGVLEGTSWRPEGLDSMNFLL